MSKTQSISKAKDGYVKITLGKEEYWVDPGELKIDDKSLIQALIDIQKAVDDNISNLKDEFDLAIKGMDESHANDVASLNERIDSLTVSLESLVKGLSQR